MCHLDQVVLGDVFEAFVHSSIFDKAVFCLEEKEGMVVNDDFGSDLFIY